MTSVHAARHFHPAAGTIGLALGWLLAAGTCSVAHAQRTEALRPVAAVRNYGAATATRAATIGVPAAPAVYTTLYDGYAGPAWNVGYGPYRPWLYRPRYFYPYRQYPLNFGYSYYNPYAYYAPWHGMWPYPYSSFYQPAYSYLPYGGVSGIYAPLGYGGCVYW